MNVTWRLCANTQDLQIMFFYWIYYCKAVNLQVGERSVAYRFHNFAAETVGEIHVDQ